MIIALKTILKKTPKKRTDRTIGQIVKAKLYRQSHTKKHTHTQSQKVKGKYYIYILKKRKRATKSINKSTNENKF